jgi:uncharacterized protein YukE
LEIGHIWTFRDFANMRSNQRKAIEALLGGKKIEQTADYAGVSRSTIYNWLKQEDFQAALRQHTRVIQSHVIARLIGSMDRAVDTLQGGCQGKANATQVRSANAIIKNVIALSQMLDQEARIQEALERLAILEQQGSCENNGRKRAETVRAWPR